MYAPINRTNQNTDEEKVLLVCFLKFLVKF